MKPDDAGQPLTMTEYFSKFGAVLGRVTRDQGTEVDVPVLTAPLAASVLALAGDVAHASQRKFAPIASFTAGIAVGRMMAAGRVSSEDAAAEFLDALRAALAQETSSD